MIDHSPLQALHQLSLITASQRDAALAHPQRSELPPNASPADALLWLSVLGIVSEDEFAALDEQLISKHSGDDYRLRRTLLDEVKAKLGQARQQVNLATLQSLLNDGLISRDTHAAVSSQVPETYAWASPAAALVWMHWRGHLSAEAWEAMKTFAASQAGFASAQGAAAVMAQADAMLVETREAAYKVAESTFWRATFGPPWVWVCGLVLLIGFAVWRIAGPTSIPSCDSQDTIITVNTMLFQANMNERSRFQNRGQTLANDMPSLRDAKEVGYDKTRAARGCTGTLEIGDQKIPYAYVIEAVPSKEGKGKQIRVVGANPRVVQSRFGHLGSKGRATQQAEPIGRANLEQALRTGLDAFNNEVNGSRNRAVERRLAERGGAPDREREIAEVEPMGNCREVGEGGLRYSCPVLLERNDRLLQAFGGGGLILIEADFTFERDTPNSASWRVSGDFAEEYRSAIMKGRLNGSSK